MCANCLETAFEHTTTTLSSSSVWRCGSGCGCSKCATTFVCVTFLHVCQPARGAGLCVCVCVFVYSIRTLTMYSKTAHATCKRTACSRDECLRTRSVKSRWLLLLALLRQLAAQPSSKVISWARYSRVCTPSLRRRMQKPRVEINYFLNSRISPFRVYYA